MQNKKKSPIGCWNNIQDRSMNVLFIDSQINDDTFAKKVQQSALERNCHHGKRKCST